MRFLFVQAIHSADDGILQACDSFEIVVVNGGAFEMAPKTLNEIEIGGIPRIPDDRQPGTMGRQVRLHSFRTMNRAVVQKQVDMIALGIDVGDQPMQEHQKFYTAFLRRDQGRHLAGEGIEGPEDWHATVLTGRGYDHPSTTGTPATREPRI